MPKKIPENMGFNCPLFLRKLRLFVDTRSTEIATRTSFGQQFLDGRNPKAEYENVATILSEKNGQFFLLVAESFVWGVYPP